MFHVLRVMCNFFSFFFTNSVPLCQVGLVVAITLFHTESLIELVGPHLRLFLILDRLPLERSVLKEIVLIALLQNESWNKCLMLRVAGQYPNSGRRYLLPLVGAVHLKY